MRPSPHHQPVLRTCHPRRACSVSRRLLLRLVRRSRCNSLGGARSQSLARSLARRSTFRASRLAEWDAALVWRSSQRAALPTSPLTGRSQAPSAAHTRRHRDPAMQQTINFRWSSRSRRCRELDEPDAAAAIWHAVSPLMAGWICPDRTKRPRGMWHRSRDSHLPLAATFPLLNRRHEYGCPARAWCR